MVQSWVPNDGLDSDDPDCGGGDDGDLSSGSDWYDDGKNYYYNTAIIKKIKNQHMIIAIHARHFLAKNIAVLDAYLKSMTGASWRILQTHLPSQQIRPHPLQIHLCSLLRGHPPPLIVLLSLGTLGMSTHVLHR